MRKLGLERLREYAAEFRYPTYYEPTLEEAREAVEIGEKVRKFVLERLNMEVKKENNKYGK